MVQIAARYTEQLGRIKKNVEKAYLYFKPNYQRFNEFRKFTFETALNSETTAVLKTLKKPEIEFNIIESYVSRLRGEFSKQEPSYIIMAGDEDPVDTQIIDIVQGHIKHIVEEGNKQGTEYNVYTDTLSGGFSVVKVWTEYANEMSFNQNIRIGRVYDPVLCGFDPLARESHKGDGHFCFELFPMEKSDFQHKYPDVDIEKLKFVRSMEGFNWSYKNEMDEIVLICDYYERKISKVKIYKLADNRSMSKEEYDNMIAKWDQIVQPPAVTEERYTDKNTIVRYRVIEDQVLEYKETDFRYLPLVFIDGNSIISRNPNDQSVQQLCRPYVYNAQGIQKLKNFAGQTLANELENMIQHKFMVAKESIPTEEDYLQAYRDVQQADVLVYNYMNELAPDKPLPPPQVVQRVNIPQEVINTFVGADNMTQNILGSFDMDIAKMNNSQTSGIALIEGATLNNSAAMPYIVGFLQGWNRIAEIIIDLIPKYFKTPRTMPIIKADGKRDYVKTNQPQGIEIKYGENALNVRVEAGVNFSVQKSKALNQIIALMQVSPLFGQFINTEGLDILLDNIEIKGIEEIKEKADNWMQQMKKMQAQQQNQPNPEMMKAQIEQAKLQQKSAETQSKFALDMEKLKADQFKVMADLKQSNDSNMIQALKSQTERFSKEVDLALKHLDQHHRHGKETIELHHMISNKGKEKE